jgi:hypothetical protein
MKLDFFECRFCDKRYNTAAGLKRHKCPSKERADFCLETKYGKTAFEAYCIWVRMRGYVKPELEACVDSKYFTSFVKFSRFFYESSIPLLQNYIEFMVEKDFLPQLWSHPEVYSQYITSFDSRVDLMEQAKITLTYIDAVAAKVGITNEELFGVMTTHEMVKMIRSRRFSPTVLYLMKSYHRYLVECTESDAAILQSMVPETTINRKLAKNPKTKEMLRGIIKQYEL